jgi:hypothetical protein
MKAWTIPNTLKFEQTFHAWPQQADCMQRQPAALLVHRSLSCISALFKLSLSSNLRIYASGRISILSRLGLDQCATCVSHSCAKNGGVWIKPPMCAKIAGMDSCTWIPQVHEVQTVAKPSRVVPQKNGDSMCRHLYV